MSKNHTAPCDSNLRLTKKTLSVLVESHGALAKLNSSLLEENGAKDETIKAKDKIIQSLNEKVLEQQQEIDELRRERDWQPNDWDNDGSSNADCHDREYGADRLGS